MMTQKERLVDLLDGLELPPIDTDGEMYLEKSDAEYIADYLLSNGVIVPPCKVGDTVYVIDDGSIYQEKIDFFDLSVYTYNGVYSIEDVFLSREAAEQALKERETKCK